MWTASRAGTLLSGGVPSRPRADRLHGPGRPHPWECQEPRSVPGTGPAPDETRGVFKVREGVVFEDSGASA